jgi:hypothetical protein
VTIKGLGAAMAVGGYNPHKRRASPCAAGALAEGDIGRLKGSLVGKPRLRSGDYRLILPQSGDTLRIHFVRRRSEAYR